MFFRCQPIEHAPPLMNARQCVSGMVNRERYISNKSAPLRIGFVCPDIGKILKLPISRQVKASYSFVCRSSPPPSWLTCSGLLQKLLGKALEGGG